jgi:hypothetical protein
MKVKNQNSFLGSLRYGKLLNDVQSIKVWLIPLSTILLLERFITSSNWVTVIVSLVGMREVSSAHEKWINKAQDKLQEYLG